MLLQLPDLLSPEEVRAMRAQLADDTLWTDGRTSAGSQAAQVKRNEQLAQGSAVALALDPPPERSTLVPPRTNNIMAGTYTHQPMRAVRAGALDHAAVASRGQHC